MSIERMRHRAFLLAREIAALCTSAMIAIAACPAPTAAEEANVAALAASYNATGAALAKVFEAAPGNVVFSPFSIGSVVAMALSGARGETASEIIGALRYIGSSGDIEASNYQTLRILAGYAKPRGKPTCAVGLRWTGARCEAKLARGGYCPAGSRYAQHRCVAPATQMAPAAKLVVANALALGPRQSIVAKQYRSLVRAAYQAEVFEAATAQAVNHWVKQKTEGRIPEILDRLDPDTPAVLLNAVYFKAQWAATFDAGATHDKPFRLSATETVQVPTMSRTGYYQAAGGADFRGLRLPYDVDGLAMVIVLPNEGADTANPRTLSSAEVAKLLPALATANDTRVALALPRFRATFKNDELAGILRQRGIVRAFEPHGADFSGITGRSASKAPLYVQRILHRAVIDVTERGTEAAAATAAEIRLISAAVEPEPELFRVDRPFHFFIHDAATNSILFQGRIADPRPLTR